MTKFALVSGVITFALLAAACGGDSSTRDATPRPGTTTYEVQAGDTVLGIADRFGVELQALLDANPALEDGDKVPEVGQILTVPEERVARPPPAPTSAGTVFPTLAANSPPFSLYAVALGDTAPSIASGHGIELSYLLAANPDLRDGEELAVGQMLIIPSEDGLLVNVRRGETPADIAARYGVTVEDILNWPGNAISSEDDISEDQLIFIPGAVPPPVATQTTTPDNP